MPRLNSANNARTTLASNINSSATSFAVANALSFPASPFRITVENEIMEVGAVTANMFSQVTRGMEGTTPTSHATGEVIEARWTAGMHQELAGKDELDVLIARIGSNSELDTEEKGKIILAINEVYGKLASHLDSPTPHQFKNHKTNKTYQFGLQVSSDGKPQIIYEEVV